ncbi:hypothetical protein TNCT_542272 [Trichonephila clavata]|nr:hypothetical protein TNCT_542272 [Trichonephila clavata]
MDIRCGETYYCSQAIVNLFPDFKWLIAINNADIFRWRSRENKHFENLHKSNIKFVVTDIENSNFYEHYIDSVDKIVSKNVLYHWSNFVDYSKPMPPYFPSKDQEEYYRAEMETLGCRDVHAVTKSIPCSYSSDEECLGEILKIVDDLINIPPRLRKEFEEDCLDIFKGLVGCIDGGPITFNIIELFLHIVK